MGLYPQNRFEYGEYLFRRDEGAEAFFKAIEQALPPVFSREYAARAIGGLVSAKTMSNADSLGQGPAVKVRVGQKVGYTREAFIAWLRNRIL